MSRLRLAILTNEGVEKQAFGQVDGYRLLVESGELKSLKAIGHRFGYDAKEPFERVKEFLLNTHFDALLIFSPGNFPDNYSQFESLKSIIGTRPIYYWEGDPWLPYNGKKKSLTNAMTWWMTNSKVVFSVAAEPHVSTYLQAGAPNIAFIPHTYCHISFAQQESESPLLTDSLEICMIASNLSRIPFLTGVPGSSRRWDLARRARRQFEEGFKLYGPGWPKKWSSGPIAFNQQAKIIRQHSISINWDNFDQYKEYASDRLPISLLAGRPHITTKHEQMLWLPEQEIGYYAEKSVGEVLSRAKEILGLSPEERLREGLNSHFWVKNRLSHRQAARYISSLIDPSIPPPNTEPWNKLPGPWSKN